MNTEPKGISFDNLAAITPIDKDDANLLLVKHHNSATPIQEPAYSSYPSSPSTYGLFYPWSFLSPIALDIHPGRKWGWDIHPKGRVG